MPEPKREVTSFYGAKEVDVEQASSPPRPQRDDSDLNRFSIMKSLEKRMDQPNLPSLGTDPNLDLALRILLPTAWLCNLGLYLWTNSDPKSVKVIANVKFSQIGNVTAVTNPTLPPGFFFNLMGTVKDFWNAGSQPLAIIIFFLSGILPYVKLSLMLICFYAVPGRHMSLTTRECILKFLDNMGKWSMLDSFMMFMMMVAFHTEFNSATLTALSIPLQAIHLNELFNFDFAIQVVPMWGFYAFVIATMMSLVVGHVVSHAHHMQVEDPSHTHHRMGDKQVKEAVAEHKPQHEMHVECCPCVCCPVFKMPNGFFTSVLIGFLCPLAIFFTLLGLSVPCISVTMTGLGGWAKNTLSYGDSISLSVWDMAKEIPKVVPEDQAYYCKFLQVVFLIFCVFAPFVYMFLAMTMWLVPMSVTALQKMHQVAEVAYSWSCIDVWVVTLIATVLQMEQVVGFITKQLGCEQLAELLEMFPAVLDVLGGDAYCAQFKLYLDPGCWYLCCAAVLIHVIAFFVDMKVSQSLKARTGLLELENEQAHHGDDSELLSMSMDSSFGDSQAAVVASDDDGSGSALAGLDGSQPQPVLATQSSLHSHSPVLETQSTEVKPTTAVQSV